ncbi:MAG: hypothetical protein AB8F78_18785 [Saprospiraceae bacterium]
MKFPTLLFVALSTPLFWTSCTSSLEQEEAPKVEAEEIAPKKVNNNALSDAQLADIKTIHATFSEVYPISLDESIKNFKKDQDPNREITIWMKMVETFNALKASGKYPSIEQQQEVFSVILASTMMPLEKIKADVELNYLEGPEIEQISELFMSSFKTAE